MNPKTQPTFRLDLRIVVIILVIIILAMLAMWRPWESSRSDRTITTTGQAEVKGEPDEFAFSPYFERKGSDATKSKAELETFGKKLLDDLVKLGVPKDNVTLNVNSYDIGLRPTGPAEPSSPESNVNLTTTIKVSSKELAQKVQDYLAATDAKGQLTSQPSFSQSKRQELENQARDKAIKDAQGKAERTASNLKTKLGKVKQVKESQNQGIAYPAIAEDTKNLGVSGLPVTPGAQPVSTSVEVIFELQ